LSDSPALIRVVIDTNVLLRALASPSSKSAHLVQVCERRRAIALLSKPLMDEYRRVLTFAGSRHEDVTPKSIELVLRRLRYFGDYQRHVRAKFSYRRDPTDSKLVELAIDAHATHIATYDPDLLSLPKSRDDAGHRFRQKLRHLQVLTPNRLLDDYPQLAAGESH
jgi:putative PIN family toxin of toxin-antitoxin system